VSETPDQQWCGLVLEYIEFDWFGMDPDAPAATQLMAECVGVMSKLVVEPRGCRLVVTGDFVRSVRDRLPDGPYRDSYGLDRNTGMVAGKTMSVTDSGFDVLMHAAVFVEEALGQGDGELTDSVLHTAAHEALHVAIAQAGEKGPPYEGLPMGRASLMHMADELLEEYRADCDLASTSNWVAGMSESLAHWHDALSRIACIEYQEHLDVDRLWRDVVQESNTAWKLLAFAVAETEPEDRTGATPSESLHDDELWTAMVAPHWKQFVEILRDVPSGFERVSREELTPTVEATADLLFDWFGTLGFEPVDAPEGFAFYIRDWSLLER
jgi:hypothetical protein